ncbi:MAG: HVO_0476 family zinc finger protein, partial [Halobacteriaceae archaeon]
MSQSEEHVALTCPACSPKLETSHEILTTHGEQATVRCTKCDHVHKERLPDQATVERDVIISQEGESFKTTVEAPPDVMVARGEEFVVETDDAIMEVRITDLQTGPEQRT